MAEHLHCSTQPRWQPFFPWSKEAWRPVSVLGTIAELDVFGIGKGSLAMVLFPLLLFACGGSSSCFRQVFYLGSPVVTASSPEHFLLKSGLEVREASFNFQAK